MAVAAWHALVLGCALMLGCAGWVRLHNGQKEEPAELPHPFAEVYAAQDPYAALDKLVNREGRMPWIFGRACYTRAINLLHTDCLSISDETSFKLAHALTNCFLKGNGHQPYECTASMSARQCSANQDERAYNTFYTFFSRIHAICRHLANHGSEAHVAALFSRLRATRAAAAARVSGTAEGPRHLEAGLAALSQQGASLATAIGEGLAQLDFLNNATATLGGEVAATLETPESQQQLHARVSVTATQLRVGLGALQAQQEAVAAGIDEMLARLDALRGVAAGLGDAEVALADRYAEIEEHAAQIGDARKAVVSRPRAMYDWLQRLVKGAGGLLASLTPGDVAYYAGGASLLWLLPGRGGAGGAAIKACGLMLLLGWPAVNRWAPRVLRPWLAARRHI